MIFLFCTLCLLVTIHNGMESFGINIFSADLDPSKMEMKMIKTTLKAKKQMDQKLYITHAEVSWQISKNTCILQLFCNNMMNCPCISGGAKVQVTGYRSQVTGHRSQVTGHRSLVTGYRSQVKKNETFGGYVLRPKMMNKTCCG